jgi:O-antigen ligase
LPSGLGSLSQAPAAASVALERFRFALSDRRALRALGAAGIALFLLGVGAAIASGDLKIVAMLLALLSAPFLVAVALKRPYLFPYGLYVVLVPFDNLLSLGSAGTVTKLVGALTVAAVLVSIFRERRIVRPALTVPLAVVYTFWMLLSAFWSIDVGFAVQEVTTMFSLLVMYVVLSIAPIEERDLRAICLMVVASGVAAAVYGIWYFHQFPPSNDGRLFVTISGRQLDPNGFADALLAPFALALVALVNARRIHAVLASLAALGILGEGILITLSREAMLACVMIALVVVLMSRRRLLALALLMPSFALILLLVPAVLPRITDAVSSGGAGRTAIWQVDLHAWLQHPVFGWGAGSAFQAYSANLLSVAPHDFAGWDRPPHNLVLKTLLDLGIVGFVVIAIAFVMMFRQLARIPRGDRLYDLRVGLTASLVGIAVASLFIDNTAEKYVWIVLCAIAQLRTVVRSRSAPPSRLTEP